MEVLFEQQAALDLGGASDEKSLSYGLCDLDGLETERQALSDLFAGAIGSYKKRAAIRCCLR